MRFLFERQQLADGRLPRNSLVNGKQAPDTGGDQLDETAYPILMAYQAGLQGDADLWTDHIRKAADFVVAHGPSFGSERWEEQSGYSPSTIAAEIAGLVAAGRIADVNGDHARARVYRATADHFQRSIKGWTVTTTGPYADRPLLHPAGQDRRPERGGHLQPRQRRPRRRPARGHRRRVPRADPARHPAGRRPRRAAVAARRGRRHPPGDGQRAGLLPLRHRDAGHRGRVRRLLRARRHRPARPPASRGRPAATGLRARVAGALRRARRAAPADR